MKPPLIFIPVISRRETVKLQLLCEIKTKFHSKQVCFHSRNFFSGGGGGRNFLYVKKSIYPRVTDSYLLTLANPFHTRVRSLNSVPENPDATMKSFPFLVFLVCLSVGEFTIVPFDCQFVPMNLAP